MSRNVLFSLLILFASACSGAAALTLEVVWSRALVVPLGNSSDSTTAVLAGFMLGIAGGAFFGSNLASRIRRVLGVYACLEFVLALFALCVPAVLGELTSLAIIRDVITNPRALLVLRWSGALLVIAIPCLVMGGTLPLLLAAVGQPRQSRRAVGLLYGANTLGATFAASFTGFVGIAEFGVTGCSRRAAMMSGIAAAAALLASRMRTSESALDRRPSISNATDFANGSPGTPRLALLVTFASGFSLLLCEVLWARMLTFVFGHDTYAFATLLAVVLLGLAAGGFMYSLVAKGDARVIAALSNGGTALAILASFYVSCYLVIRSGHDPFGLGDRLLGSGALSVEVLREFAFAPVLVVLPCVLSGIGYPAAITLFAGSRGSMATATGAIGLANGLGAALGALVAALGFLSFAGIQGALSIAAVALAVVALLTLRTSPASRPRRVIAFGPALLCAAAVILAPRDMPKRVLHAVVGSRHQQLLFYAEARTATVSVIKNRINGERQLLVNAVNEVTTRLVHDQSFKLLGQLGPLLHPNPKRGIMICLGAGLAAGSVLTHPIERLDVVDLLWSVQRGARYFEDENNHALDDPRLHLHENDGRQYLLTTPDRYDFAVVDSTHPKSVDSWILYTREFFELLRSRLNPGGIAVEWLPLHGLSEREFASVVATFQSVFPQMTLWASAGFETYGHVGYAKLVGQRADSPMRIDLEQVQARLELPTIHRDLERYGMARVPEILDQFVAGPDRIREWTRGMPLLTDDRPFLAYTTRLSQGRPMTPNLLVGLREFPEKHLIDRAALAPERNHEIESAFDAQGLVLAGELNAASAFYPEGEKIRRYIAQRETVAPYYESLARTYPSDPEKLFEAATQLGTQGHAELAAALFEKALAVAPNSPRLRLNEALLKLAEGQPQAASERLSRLRWRAPDWPLLEQNLGVALLAQGEPGAAKRELALALASAPLALGARDAMIDAEMALGQWQDAEAHLRALLRDEPHLDRAVWRLAIVREQLGKADDAVSLFARAAQMNPYNEQYIEDWVVRLTSKDPQRALELSQRLATLYPK